MESAKGTPSAPFRRSVRRSASACRHPYGHCRNRDGPACDATARPLSTHSTTTVHEHATPPLAAVPDGSLPGALRSTRNHPRKAMHRRCQSPAGEGYWDDGASVRAIHDRTGTLARDLPETALHATSRRPTTRPSAAPFTCAVVWVREVLKGGANHPRIDEGCGRRFDHEHPSGCAHSSGHDALVRSRRHGAVGSASVSRSRWHQVIAALTAKQVTRSSACNLA